MIPAIRGRADGHIAVGGKRGRRRATAGRVVLRRWGMLLARRYGASGSGRYCRKRPCSRSSSGMTARGALPSFLHTMCSCASAPNAADNVVVLNDQSAMPSRRLLPRNTHSSGSACLPFGVGPDHRSDLQSPRTTRGSVVPVRCEVGACCAHSKSPAPGSRDANASCPIALTAIAPCWKSRRLGLRLSPRGGAGRQRIDCSAGSSGRRPRRPVPNQHALAFVGDR